MGIRFRNVAKSKKLGGKGKLTSKLIDKLSIYYRLAICRHYNSIEDMEKAIWATLYHQISTDEKPQHHLCSEGSRSWCAWQLRKAIGGDESNYKHGPAMPNEVFEGKEDLRRVKQR